METNGISAAHNLSDDPVEETNISSGHEKRRERLAIAGERDGEKEQCKKKKKVESLGRLGNRRRNKGTMRIM